MASVPLTLRVDSQVATAYLTATEDEQRKMQALVAVWLRQLVSDPRRPLAAIMDDMGAAAEAAGLTPEELERILDEG